ncbi:glycine oxidase maturase GoxB [Thalassospira alkalitolerans]|uniref:glycine oxidase maturase GoxB n=1 Tax=Thalassospira alkalitolerans TaxID=1293890 RepID=UPI0030EDEE60|tara:strand:+ start:50713 stop:51840 length:1128 start_codon:yes stop_codon:yes gene_type:complete
MTPTGIAVIGGGIAGATSCIALAKAGLRPCWIAPAPGDGPHLGETLSPAANTILENLGLSGLLTSDRHRHANTTFSAWGHDQLRERNSIIHLEGAGMVVNRAAFERDLCDAALETRPELFQTTLRDAQSTPNGWQLVLGDGRSIQTRFVLDCTGRKAVIGQQNNQMHRADQLVTAWSCLCQDDTKPDVEPTPATLIEAVSNGWWYASLLPDRRLMVCYFSDPDLLPSGMSHDVAHWESLISQTNYIKQWVESANFTVTSPPSLASAGTTWLSSAAGENWASVGDAAAAFDPLSSHGMTTALWMAAQASNAAKAYLENDLDPLEKYRAAVSKGVDDFLTQRRKIYGQEHRFRDSAFWHRRHQDVREKSPGQLGIPA